MKNESRTAPLAQRDEDQRVYLRGVSWDDFERILAIRGESSGVRVHYLEGDLELMSPSRSHEGIGKHIARLLECWAEERDVKLDGFGSWTIKKQLRERGAEPDECYLVGCSDCTTMNRPDIAIEVIWTSGGLDKLEIYRGLDVPEVWIWDDDRLTVWSLRGDRYEAVPASEVLPALDLEGLLRFLDINDQTAAVKRYRSALRAG